MSCFEYKTCRTNSYYGFREDVNIFREQFKNHLDEINAHRDLFTFKIAEDDNFISNILYSIMIYKYRNNIFKLSDQDYANIIYELYKDNIIPITKQTEKFIPKKLKYIKNDEIRNKYK